MCQLTNKRKAADYFVKILIFEKEYIPYNNNSRIVEDNPDLNPKKRRYRRNQLKRDSSVLDFYERRRRRKSRHRLLNQISNGIIDFNNYENAHLMCANMGISGDYETSTTRIHGKRPIFSLLPRLKSGFTVNLN